MTADRTELLAALLAQTRLDAERLATPARPVDRGAPDGRPALALPPPAPLRRGLEAALADRTAVRHYAPAPLTLPEVTALLGGAEELDARAWPGEHADGAALELWLAAWRVEGLAPGLYRYGPTPRLARVAALPPQAEAEALVLQREFAAAPALVLLTGDLGAALERHGAHGHRLLLLRAGAAANGAWLTALGLGLVGTVFAGLLPAALRTLVGADGFTRAPLLAFAAGRPADGSPLPTTAKRGGDTP